MTKSNVAAILLAGLSLFSCRKRHLAWLAVLVLLAAASEHVCGQTFTLPVMYINTAGGMAVTSKTVYVNGTYYLTDLPDGGHSLGSEAEPLSLEIRGRGNSSWRGKKKPYKLRLGEKQGLLGMASNRHWVLLNFYDATLAGMELGRLAGMGWNAHARPVEVVLNGDYVGLYLLSENNRISGHRIDIYKQADNNEDEATIPYGWLVEVDNYKNPDQIVIRENGMWNLNITYHSPDSLSELQKEWLTSDFTAINAAIYAPDKQHSTWEEFLDVEAMARYFVVQEVLDNPDGFHGSFFLHKDFGDDARWVAGPLWDLSCGMRAKTDYTFRMKTSYAFTPHWIGELLKDEDFCCAVRRVWTDLYPSRVQEWMDCIDAALFPCAEAYAGSSERWSPGETFTPLQERAAELKRTLTANLEWFDNHLPGDSGSGIDELRQSRGSQSSDRRSPNRLIFDLTGRRLAAPPARGLYIEDGRVRLR